MLEQDYPEGLQLTADQGKSVRRKEWQKGAVMDGQTNPCHLAEVRGVKSEGLQWSLRNERGKVFFKCLSSCFSLCQPIFNGNELNSFSPNRACFAPEGNW